MLATYTSVFKKRFSSEINKMLIDVQHKIEIIAPVKVG